MTRIYLKPEFLDWPVDEADLDDLESKKRFRAYEIWRHARDRLSEGESDLYRIDCISALKRAVNHRIKTIFNEHSFEEVPTQLGKKRVLERLQEYGIIRPALIQQLFEIRNAIDHEDADAPTVETCKNHIDVTWYFLKSTDPLVDKVHTAIEYWNPEGDETVTVSINPENIWREYSLSTVTDKAHTRTRKPKKGDWLCISNSTTKSVKDGKVHISGTFSVEGEAIYRIVADYFATFGYWSDGR